jgi:hypothetical protein
MKTDRILVCGGRYYADGVVVFLVMSFLRKTWGDFSLLIHGGAGKELGDTGIPVWGADKLAGFWAVMSGIPVEVYPYRSEYGRAGGPVRNRQMLEEGKPDVIFAFPGEAGTRDMVKIGLEADIPVYALRHRGTSGAVRRIRIETDLDP